MSFEWNDETIATLTSLWDEGMKVSDIGDRLGTTKNAVVGKARRLGLPPRPTPIKREKGLGKKAPKGTQLMDLTDKTCRWPEGDPRDDDFHFCGQQTEAGKPYCVAHQRRARVQPSNRQKAEEKQAQQLAQAGGC